LPTFVALDVGRDVDEPGDVSVLDHRGGGPHPHSGHVTQADVTTVGRVDEQALDAREARAGVRRAPHHHVEDLLVLEEVADPQAGEHRRGGAAHVAGLDAERLGLGQVDLDLHRRLGRRRRDVRPTTPFVPATAAWTSAAVFWSVSRLSLPNTRTVIWSCVGLSTSVIRFFV
jgi:hypothetical protein